MRKETDHDKLKIQANQYMFDIRHSINRKEYWDATKLVHELYELLNMQPYHEKTDNKNTSELDKFIDSQKQLILTLSVDGGENYRLDAEKEKRLLKLAEAIKADAEGTDLRLDDPEADTMA